MRFVLQNIESGRNGNKYVAKPGSAHSYTSGLDTAQRFSSREEADQNRCEESERVVDLFEILFRH